MRVAMLVANAAADVFLTYCTNAQLAVGEVPSLQVVKLPATLEVGASYGVAVRGDAPADAFAFVAYLRSPAGQRKLAQYGFAPP